MLALSWYMPFYCLKYIIFASAPFSSLSLYLVILIRASVILDVFIIPLWITGLKMVARMIAGLPWIGLALVSLLALAGTASAYHEAGDVGPYNVSFEMNTTDDYRVIVETTPMRGVMSDGIDYITYNLTVDSPDSFAYLFITRYNGSMDTSINANHLIVSDLLADLACADPKIFQPLIDSHAGVLGYCDFPSGVLVTCASYSPDAVGESMSPRGMTNCRYLSTFPWEITRDMLASLHVEVPPEDRALFLTSYKNYTSDAGQEAAKASNSGTVLGLRASKNQAMDGSSILRPVKLGRGG